MGETRSGIRSVAVVGVGSMGAPIARHILKAGFDLFVCDTNAAVLADFQRQGARVALKPSDCAAADLVIVLVTTPEQTLRVVLGKDGVLAGTSSDRAPIIAIMSTVPLETIHELRVGLGHAADGLVDAPFSGGLSRAEQGTLAVMVGGDADMVDVLRPVLGTFSRTVLHCGPVGTGQAMKIVNNIVGNANLVIAGEAYRMAIDLGLDLADVAEVLEAGSGRNAFSCNPDGVPAAFEPFARDRPSFDGLLGLMRKDISFAAQIAARREGSYPAISSLKALMDSLDGETYDTWRMLMAAPSRGRPAASEPSVI